jgi:hypothetical protein
MLNRRGFISTIIGIIISALYTSINKGEDILEGDIGVKMAIYYEKIDGREATDISDQLLGYHILSREKDGHPRYILVKDWDDRGRIVLSENELITMRRYLDKFWIYLYNHKGKHLERIKISRLPQS